MDNKAIYLGLIGDNGGSIKDYLKTSAKIKNIDERRLILKDMYQAGLINEAYYKESMESLLGRVSFV